MGRIHLVLRLHSLCILQGGQRILGGDLKFLEQKKGGYENCLNISGGMLIFCKILSSFCTDIYFDISWEGGGGRGGINFSADCLGGSENLYGPWGGI